MREIFENLLLGTKLQVEELDLRVHHVHEDFRLVLAAEGYRRDAILGQGILTQRFPHVLHRIGMQLLWVWQVPHSQETVIMPCNEGVVILRNC